MNTLSLLLNRLGNLVQREQTTIMVEDRSSEGSKLNAMLNDYWYAQFGRIINLYASMETGFKLVLGGMLGISLEEVGALAAPYSAQELLEVFVTVLNAKRASEPKLAKLDLPVKTFKDVGVLRNHIAHDSWIHGSKPGSIRPISLGIRKNVLVVRETSEEFTQDRLQGAIILLSVGSTQLVTTYRECGYADAQGM